MARSDVRRAPCPYCRGTGELPSGWCGQCKGLGTIRYASTPIEGYLDPDDPRTRLIQRSHAQVGRAFMRFSCACHHVGAHEVGHDAHADPCFTPATVKVFKHRRISKKTPFLYLCGPCAGWWMVDRARWLAKKPVLPKLAPKHRTGLDAFYEGNPRRGRV